MKATDYKNGNVLHIFRRTRIKKHVQQFHRALNEHYRIGGKHLYDPAEMETFSNKYAPGLFAQLYKSILNDDKEKPSKKHMEMQKTRVVSLLHNLSCMATRYMF